MPLHQAFLISYFTTNSWILYTDYDWLLAQASARRRRTAVCRNGLVAVLRRLLQMDQDILLVYTSVDELSDWTLRLAKLFQYRYALKGNRRLDVYRRLLLFSSFPVDWGRQAYDYMPEF